MHVKGYRPTCRAYAAVELRSVISFKFALETVRDVCDNQAERVPSKPRLSEKNFFTVRLTHHPDTSRLSSSGLQISRVYWRN